MVARSISAAFKKRADRFCGAKLILSPVAFKKTKGGLAAVVLETFRGPADQVPTAHGPPKNERVVGRCSPWRSGAASVRNEVQDSVPQPQENDRMVGRCSPWRSGAASVRNVV